MSNDNTAKAATYATAEEIAEMQRRVAEGTGGLTEEQKQYVTDVAETCGAAVYDTFTALVATFPGLPPQHIITSMFIGLGKGCAKCELPLKELHFALDKIYEKEARGDGPLQ